MCMLSRNSKQGFTLVELVIGVAVAMILASIAAPNLQRIIQNNKMTALHNELLAVLSFKRSTAITRGTWINFCKSNPKSTGCDLSKDSCDSGWIVFSDKNSNGIVDVGEKIIGLKKDMPDTIRMTSSRQRILYNSEGYAIGFTGKFTFCDSRGDSAKKGLVMSNSGRVRVATVKDRLATCLPFK